MTRAARFGVLQYLTNGANIGRIYFAKKCKKGVGFAAKTCGWREAWLNRVDA